MTTENMITEPAEITKISEIDQLKLVMAKEARNHAKTKVDLALSESNLSEMTYTYFADFSCNMSNLDSLGEDSIVKNGAVPKKDVE